MKRTKLQFPEPKSDGSQSPKIPVPKDPKALAPVGTHIRMHIPTYHTHTKIKFFKLPK